MISDSKLVPIAFIDVASRLLPPPLVSFCEGKDHAVAPAAAALAPFLLILLKSGPTNNDETLLSFSRSLKKRFLIFFLPPHSRAASKLSVHVRRLQIHRSRNQNKKKGTITSPKKGYYQHIILYAHRWRQMKRRWLLLQDVTMRDTTDLGEKEKKRTHTRRGNSINAKGFSVFFSSCMMMKE